MAGGCLESGVQTKPEQTLVWAGRWLGACCAFAWTRSPGGPWEGRRPKVPAGGPGAPERRGSSKPPALDPAEVKALRSLRGGPCGSPQSSKKGINRFGGRFGVPHFKGDMAGYSPAACRLTAQPTAACETGRSSVARRRALGSRAASPAGFGAFVVLNGSGLTQFKLCGCWQGIPVSDC